MLKQRLQDDMKAAMKAGDKRRLGVVRLINAAIKQREVDERVELDDTQMPESRVCARDTRRVDPSPPGLAQGDRLLCPGSPCGPSRTRLPVGPPGTTVPTNGSTACRMRSAYRLRSFGTNAPSLLRQYARAYAYPGLRAFASLSMARSGGPMRSPA